MKARIINGNKFDTIYTDEYLEENKDKVIDRVLVSEWVVVDKLPTEEEKKYIKCLFDFENEIYYEGATPEEMNQDKIKKAIEIDLFYTKKIADLMVKHNDKFIEALYNETTYIIPQLALDEKQELKNECNAKIAELGITDYTYRQSVPKLVKTL